MQGMRLRLPMSRREALRVSLFSTTGLLLGATRVSRAAEPAAAEAHAPGGPKAKARSVIQIFLWG